PTPGVAGPIQSAPPRGGHCGPALTNPPRPLAVSVCQLNCNRCDCRIFRESPAPVFRRKAPPKRGQEHVAEGGSLVFRSEDNSERGDWFHKEKPRWTRGAERSKGRGIVQTQTSHLS